MTKQRRKKATLDQSLELRITKKLKTAGSAVAKKRGLSLAALLRQLLQNEVDLDTSSDVSELEPRMI